jgi:ligand-binding SRPBCC domain-containing protein
MKIFEFDYELWLPRPVSEIFAFFSDAANLQTITPPWVNFEILTPQPITLRRGALIDYRLRIHALPVRWQTEITAWEPPHRFVDEQKRGPYRQWIHEHRFTAHNGGTQCSDAVRYAVLGGDVINRLFVRRDVEKIFAFRRHKLEEILGRR